MKYHGILALTSKECHGVTGVYRSFSSPFIAMPMVQLCQDLVLMLAFDLLCGKIMSKVSP